MRAEIEHWAEVVLEPAKSAGPSVLIALVLENAARAGSILESLIVCADDLLAINAEVLLFNHSPDDVKLLETLALILPRAKAAFACRLARNEMDLRFGETMNRAVAMAVSRRMDLLILDSNAIVHPGALPEMLRVAARDPMIGFVSPRSDNATLAALPVAHRDQAPDGPFDAAPYAQLGARLPEFSYVPMAAAFCTLIRWQVLAEFGGFDTDLDFGLHGEAELVMRAGRCGYRVAHANRAFVRRPAEGPLTIAAGSVPDLEQDAASRAMLEARYPEYGAVTAAYLLSPEWRAEWLLGTLNPDASGRLDLAFDFSNFLSRNNGTFKAGRQLLKVAAEAWRDRFNISVLCSEEVYRFHGYAELGVTRRDPDGPELFAAIFRVGQPFQWNTVERLLLKAAVIGIYMLDTISIDCTQLTSPDLFNIWQSAFTYGDFFVAPSAQSLRQIGLRFQIPVRMARGHSLHSLDLADYRLGTPASIAIKPQPEGGGFLIIGNHFPHKYLVPTANALARSFPDRKVVALGQPKTAAPADCNPYALPALSDAVNLTGVHVGELSDDQIASFYADAEAVIFPSHYEGFGMPILEALAAKRPVFVRPLPVFLELWEGLNRDPNIHFYDTTAELVDSLVALPRWVEPPPRLDEGARVRRVRFGIYWKPPCGKRIIQSLSGGCAPCNRNWRPSSPRNPKVLPIARRAYAPSG